MFLCGVCMRLFRTAHLQKNVLFWTHTRTIELVWLLRFMRACAWSHAHTHTRCRLCAGAIDQVERWAYIYFVGWLSFRSASSMFSISFNREVRAWVFFFSVSTLCWLNIVIFCHTCVTVSRPINGALTNDPVSGGHCTNIQKPRINIYIILTEINDRDVGI